MGEATQLHKWENAYSSPHLTSRDLHQSVTVPSGPPEKPKHVSDSTKPTTLRTDLLQVYIEFMSLLYSSLSIPTNAYRSDLERFILAHGFREHSQPWQLSSFIFDSKNLWNNLFISQWIGKHMGSEAGPSYNPQDPPLVVYNCQLEPTSKIFYHFPN